MTKAITSFAVYVISVHVIMAVNFLVEVVNQSYIHQSEVLQGLRLF